MERDILCHCHLRWDFVWQRPQHLMTRLARRHRVFFLEDAMALPEGDNNPRLEVRDTPEGVIVACPMLLPRTGDPQQDAEVDRRNGELFLPMIKQELERRGITAPIHWFYTPMAYWLAGIIPHSGIIYDCMDELSMFKNPPAGILEREAELLDCADLVFTGGRSLYLGKVDRHPQVHMFASGVEVEHFARATAPETAVPEDIASIARPRFTYTGVIDERLDLDLLKAAAELRPQWQFVMIGPVVKIEEDALPRLPNIHFLGQKPYAQLPEYLKGTEVAMMPFALNDATKFISPTKTLEYMAARRPILSTGIADVVAYYDKIVWLVDSAESFAAAGEEALHPSEDRLDEGVQTARAQTWDSIAERMDALITRCLTDRAMCTVPVNS